MSKHQTNKLHSALLININTVHIIGLGLIGGSIAKNIMTNTNCQVIAIDSNPIHRAQAVNQNLCHVAKAQLDNKDKLELVIIATPLSAIASILKTIKPLCQTKTIMTDVASVKTPIVQQAETILGQTLSQQFIPGHPMAGRAIHGPNAAQLDLFCGKRVILTPAIQTTPVTTQALTVVKQLWQLCQAESIELMTAEQHDMIVAQVSHLPQLLSYGYMNSFANQEQLMKYGAGGFAYLTQLASSDPVMWRDICQANKTNILKAMTNFQQQLNALTHCLEQDNYSALAELFTQATQCKKLFSQKK